VSIATVFGMMLGILAPAVAAETGTFTGTVMAPDNSFASGFTVVFKDAASGQEFRSDPTGPTGEYQIAVPTGGRYKLDSVVAPDGTKLAVQNVPPIPVRVAGSNKLDVKFSNTAPPATAAVAAAAPPAAAAGAAAPTPAAQPTVAAKPAPEEEKKKKPGAAVPWWKKPGPIVGIVLGSVAVAALAIGAGGDDEPPVSQSTPDK
jgi:hypothetical protein